MSALHWKFFRIRPRKPTEREQLMSDLTRLSSAVLRATDLIKMLLEKAIVMTAENSALKAKALEDQMAIDTLTAQLEASIPDLGGSMGGVVG